MATVKMTRKRTETVMILVRLAEKLLESDSNLLKMDMDKHISIIMANIVGNNDIDEETTDSLLCFLESIEKVLNEKQQNPQE